MGDETSLIAAERERIIAANNRPDWEPPSAKPWKQAYLFLHSGRKRLAAKMLHEAGVFPTADTRCLEVGFGLPSAGWLGDLITWGVRETNLHGLELDPIRTKRVREILPIADLRVGDATAIPWDSEMFHLAIASTVFTSILNPTIRQMVADEITRVLAPGGALLWYDFAFNNPRNPHVRKVTRGELKNLFPRLKGRIKSLTLAPPLARLVAPRSWALATLLETIPLLRTHLLAVLVKTY